MRKSPFHKAFCILWRCDISKCIVLLNANFIEVQCPNIGHVEHGAPQLLLAVNPRRRYDSIGVSLESVLMATERAFQNDRTEVPVLRPPARTEKVTASCRCLVAHASFATYSIHFLLNLSDDLRNKRLLEGSGSLSNL